MAHCHRNLRTQCDVARTSLPWPGPWVRSQGPLLYIIFLPLHGFPCDLCLSCPSAGSVCPSGIASGSDGRGTRRRFGTNDPRAWVLRRPPRGPRWVTRICWPRQKNLQGTPSYCARTLRRHAKTDEECQPVMRKPFFYLYLKTPANETQAKIDFIFPRRK